MTIVEIRGYVLDARMAEPIRNSVGMIDRRRALVVEIVTDSGISGWGETQDAPADAWAVIESRLAPVLLGSAPEDARLELLARAPESKADALAMSAVDIALWDLRGRLEDTTIAELAGGAIRTSLPAYASGPFMVPGDAPYSRMLDDAAGYVDGGYRAIKLRCGTTPEDDVALVARMSERLGPDIRIAIDINTGYARHGAAELVDLALDSGLVWIEEPLDPLDLSGYVELGARSSVPLAAGEALWRRSDFVDAIDAGALGVLQPDLFLCGGITGTLEIAALAQAAGIPLLPHVFGSGINFAASLQVAAVLPASSSPGEGDYPWFEFDQSDNPLRHIGGAAVLDSDGTVTVPNGPGIGVEIRTEMFEPFVSARYRITADRPGND